MRPPMRFLLALVALSFCLPAVQAVPAIVPQPTEPAPDLVFTPQCDYLQFLAELVCFTFQNWVSQMVFALLGIIMEPVTCVVDSTVLEIVFLKCV